MSLANSISRPDSKVTADGKEVKQAKMNEVRTKTVQCDEHGKAVPKDAEFTHYKTTFTRFTVEEVHKIDGELTPLQFTISQTEVRDLVVQLGSEKHTASGLELLLKKSLASFPQDATVSIGYESPQGGDWFVEGHPVVLDAKPESAGSCCTLQ